jgi:hypothetical protein
LADIAALVGRGPKDGSVRNALAELVADGELKRDGRTYTRCKKVQKGRGKVAPRTAGSVEGATDEPLPPGVPEPPAGLGTAGRDVWIDAWSTAWTAEPDTAGIAHLARLEDEAEALTKAIDEQGVVSKRPIVSPKGDVVGDEWVGHPLTSDLRRLDAQLVALRATLGMDPASRARLALDAMANRPDAVDELIERRQQRLAGGTGGRRPTR